MSRHFADAADATSSGASGDSNAIIKALKTQATGNACWLR